jgi:hypothetical protein
MLFRFHFFNSLIFNSFSFLSVTSFFIFLPFLFFRSLCYLPFYSILIILTFPASYTNNTHNSFPITSFHLLLHVHVHLAHFISSSYHLIFSIMFSTILLHVSRKDDNFQNVAYSDILSLSSKVNLPLPLPYEMYGMPEMKKT